MQNIPNAITIAPVVIDFFKKVIASQITWRIISIDRNSTDSAEASVIFYNDDAIEVGSCIIEIPADILSAWVDDSIIDEYLLKVLELIEVK